MDRPTAIFVEGIGAAATSRGPKLLPLPRLRSASATVNGIPPVHDLGAIGWWNASWLSRNVEVRRTKRWAGNSALITAALDDGGPLAAAGFINPQTSVSPFTGGMLFEAFGAFNEGKLKLWLIPYPLFTEVTATISIRVPVWRRRRTEAALRRRLNDLEDEVLNHVHRFAHRKPMRPRLRVAR